MMISRRAFGKSEQLIFPFYVTSSAVVIAAVDGLRDHVLTYPTGILAGDVLVIHQHVRLSNAPNLVLPSGYTSRFVTTSGFGMRLSTKTANGTESGTTITVQIHGSSAQPSHAIIHVIRNAEYFSGDLGASGNNWLDGPTLANPGQLGTTALLFIQLNSTVAMPNVINSARGDYDTVYTVAGSLTRLAVQRLIMRKTGGVSGGSSVTAINSTYGYGILFKRIT